MNSTWQRESEILCESLYKFHTFNIYLSLLHKPKIISVWSVLIKISILLTTNHIEYYMSSNILPIGKWALGQYRYCWLQYVNADASYLPLCQFRLLHGILCLYTVFFYLPIQSDAHSLRELCKGIASTGCVPTPNKMNAFLPIIYTHHFVLPGDIPGPLNYTKGI